MKNRPVLALAGLGLLLAGCFKTLAGTGGAASEFEPPRRVEPRDVALPPGYRIEVVATGLTYPTAVVFDAAGAPVVVESGYSYGEDFTEPRLVRIGPDGSQSVIARGEHPPWTGADSRDGVFFVAEGGAQGGGRIVRIDPDGRLTVLVADLPSLGDHHTNGPAIAPDGTLYFSVGTATNSGVVGLDNSEFGWLERHPDFHDLPCRDLTLRGRNYQTENPLTEQADQVSTGAFVPFGQPTHEGEVIPGRIPCTGAVMKVGPEGGTPQLVAWGFRNPFGLAFAADGKLWLTENGFDERGSRPVFGGADYLWEVKPGLWYGWPDYAGGRLLDENWNKPAGGQAPDRLLAADPNPPPAPAASFGVHSSSNRFDFSRSERFGHVGQAFVAQFGDMAPKVGEVFSPVGFQVVRADPTTGGIEVFAANRGDKHGPASLLGTGGLERPVDARFDPSGEALYVVDFGVLGVSQKGSRPWRQTGVLWRITRTEEGVR